MSCTVNPFLTFAAHFHGILTLVKATERGLGFVG